MGRRGQWADVQTQRLHAPRLFALSASLHEGLCSSSVSLASPADRRSPCAPTRGSEEGEAVRGEEATEGVTGEPPITIGGPPNQVTGVEKEQITKGKKRRGCCFQGMGEGVLGRQKQISPHFPGVNG